MEESQTSNTIIPEPMAVYFTENGEGLTVPISKLSEKERQEGGYLLIEPGVGSQWVPRYTGKTMIIQTGMTCPDFQYYTPAKKP